MSDCLLGSIFGNVLSGLDFKRKSMLMRIGVAIYIIFDVNLCQIKSTQIYVLYSSDFFVFILSSDISGLIKVVTLEK